MNKKMLLALLLAMVMALTGCALIEKDPELDAAQIALTIDDISYTKGELKTIVDQYYAEMSTYYNYFGMTFDQSLALDQTVDMLTEEIVLQKKAKEFGVAELTEDEESQAQANALTNYQNDMEYFATSYFSGYGLSDSELAATTKEWMDANGYELESYVETERTAIVSDKVKAAAMAEIAVTDEEIRAEYDVRVADAKESYETNLHGYGVYVNYEAPVYYRPEGYRYVKQIKRTFNETDQAIIKDLDSQIAAAKSELSAAEGDQIAEAEAKVADLEAQKQAAIDTACANILPKMNEIAAKLAAGEDFDALVAKYNEDPYMLEAPIQQNGYAVCAETNLIPDALFAQEAMKLANVGDVSEPVLSTNGMAIMLYVADEVAGPVDLELVKDTIRSELMAEKQEEGYEQLKDQWIKETKVNLNRKVMAD